MHHGVVITVMRLHGRQEALSHWAFWLAQWLLCMPFTSVDPGSNPTTDQSLACVFSFQSQQYLSYFLDFFIKRGPHYFLSIFIELYRGKTIDYYRCIYTFTLILTMGEHILQQFYNYIQQK